MKDLGEVEERLVAELGAYAWDEMGHILTFLARNATSQPDKAPQVSSALSLFADLHPTPSLTANESLKYKTLHELLKGGPEIKVVPLSKRPCCSLVPIVTPLCTKLDFGPSGSDAGRKTSLAAGGEGSGSGLGVAERRAGRTRAAVQSSAQLPVRSTPSTTTTKK